MRQNQSKMKERIDKQTDIHMDYPSCNPPFEGQSAG